MSEPSVARAETQPAPRHTYRIRFAKEGDLRLVSHHDLMHVFERLLRRAQLPFASTQGFHPMPRLVFAQSLALGIAGLREVADLDLTEPLPAALVHDRLTQHAAPGLTFHSVQPLEGRHSSQVRRAFYRLPLPKPADECSESAGSPLAERCQSLLAQPHLWIERTRPQPRKLDLRPYLDEVFVQDDCLHLSLWVTPNGAARPDEITQLLGLPPATELGVFWLRTDLELADEIDTAHQPAASAAAPLTCTL